jgi:hypothetical protein
LGWPISQPANALAALMHSAPTPALCAAEQIASSSLTASWL